MMLPFSSSTEACMSFFWFSQCNNPMTKEPKLEAAVRIVPEWQDYDQEVKQLQIRFQEEKAAAARGKEPRADGRPAWLREGRRHSSDFWWLQTTEERPLF